MTVEATYSPTTREPKDSDVEELRYWFRWEWISEDQIEVYEINDTLSTRVKVPKQDYYVTGRAQVGDRGPTKKGGNIYFNRDHPVGTTKVIIERNTLIDQTTDMPNVRAFNTRVIEQTLDYITMICQEMVQRKCSAVTATPITQEVVFGSYLTITASQVNFALNKLANIINEISATVTDCSDTPGEA